LEVNSQSTKQEIPVLLWNLKVHYPVNKAPPLDPILSQMNPIHTSPYWMERSVVVLWMEEKVSKIRKATAIY